MKVRITGKGLYGNKGEIPVGTTVDVKEEPTGWVGKYIVLDDGKDEGDDDGDKTAVTNPKKNPVKEPAKAADKD